MKFLMLFTIFLFVSNSFASCPELVLEQKDLLDASVEVKKCVIESERFAEGLNGSLCNDDQSDLSEEFKKYIEFQIDHNETFERIKTEDNPAKKARLMVDLGIIERDWKLLGFREEIDASLYHVSVAKSECQNN